MFGTLLLTAGLAVSQPPTAMPAPPVVAAPSTLAPSLGTIVEEAPAAPAAGPTGLLMQALDGTPFGKTLADRRVSFGGFLDVSHTFTNTNLNRIPTGMGYSFNQDLPQWLWLYANKDVDKESKELTAGYHVDFFYGSMYQYTISRGLYSYQLTGRNGSPNQRGFDTPQAYAEFYAPNVLKGLDVKVGRMFARFGVESLDPSKTILPSYSYAFTYNPYTYTGVATDLQVSDKVTITNDFYIGNDIWFDDASRFFYLGAINYAFTKNTSLRTAVMLGDNKFDAARGVAHPALFDVVFTHKFTDDLTYTFEYLYGGLQNVPGIGTADWQHFVNYLTYKVSDKTSVTGRMEFYDDRQGQRTGTSGLYTAYTLGASYTPVNYLVIRPEVRYDHNGNKPFDGKADLFGFTLNAILKF